MEITETPYHKIEHCMPRQRGNVSLSNLQVLNAILYVAEHGLQVAWSTQTLWQLAHHLHSHESLGEKWRA